MKTYLNNVMFKNGIIFPYNSREIQTTLGFSKKAMHIFMEVQDEAEKFLDKQFLDDDTKIDALHMHRIIPITSP